MTGDRPLDTVAGVCRNGTEVRAVGDAYCPDTDHPANLLVRFAAGTWLAGAGQYCLLGHLLCLGFVSDNATWHRLIEHCFDCNMRRIVEHCLDVLFFSDDDHGNCRP